SMKYMEPDSYRYIADKLADTKRERTRYINDFIRPVKEKLTQGKFDFEIYGRPKSIHSIWTKMKKKGVSFDEVYDLFAIRIILNSPPEHEKEDCWKVYSLVTDEYNPSPERLRDWLSNPKSNGYEALHTTVMGPHGKYKEGTTEENRFDKWFQQIRDMLASQDTNSIDFLQDFKLSFLAEEIYVYSPKGDIKMLPSGASALDFAFAVHTAVGEKCIGAKVNHKLVPIGHKLRSGDQVEIITSTKQKPKSEWLKMVVTTKAKSKIKDSLKEEKRTIAEEGKNILQRKLDGLGVPMSQANVEEITNFYKLNSSLDLFYDIAVKKTDLRELKDFQVLGDKISAPKVVKPPVEEKALTTLKKDKK